MLLYVFFIVGVVVCELGNDDMFNMFRCLYVFFLVLMYLWCLKVFFIYKIIGIIFLIIKEMVFILNVCVIDNYVLFKIMKKENIKINFECIVFYVVNLWVFLFIFL